MSIKLNFLRVPYVLFFAATIFLLSSCKKTLNEEQPAIKISGKTHLDIHQQKIQTWMDFIPFGGKFSSVDTRLVKTSVLDGKICTVVPIGNTTTALYFISSKDKFHVYGIDAGKLSRVNNYNGSVGIYDFQTLAKTTLIYKDGSLDKFQRHLQYDALMNPYKNDYQINKTLAREELGSGELIRRVRKFFCELFGGNWIYCACGSSSEQCSTGGGNPDEVQVPAPPEAGGNYELGLIWDNLNNPGFFDPNGHIWNTVNTGLSSFGANVNWSAGNSNILDPIFTNPSELSSLLYILNTKYNQQPASPFDGSLNDVLDYMASPVNGQPTVPISTFVLRAGANGATEGFFQAHLIQNTNSSDNYGLAFASAYFNREQVINSSISGLTHWTELDDRISRAMANSFEYVLANLIADKYAATDYNALGLDFQTKFIEQTGIDPLTYHYIIVQTAINKAENPDWPYWKCFYYASLDIIHFGLDVAGMVPIAGECFDLVNSGLYALRGDGVNASLSLLSTIPGAGWFGTTAKWAKRTMALSDGTRTTLNWIKVGNTINFGSRGQLKRVLQLRKGMPNQAHHIIPWEFGINPIVQAAAKAKNAFHMNELRNGFGLHISRHSGSHPNYAQRVRSALETIRTRIGDNPNPEVAANEVRSLITRIENAIRTQGTKNINDITF